MSRITVPVVLIVVLLVALAAVALPEIFGYLVNIENSSSGVSSLVADFAGRIPVVLFLIVGIAFVGLLTIGRR